MKVSILPVTPFQQNCSLLVCERTRKGAIVDPGGEVERLVAHAEERCDEVEKILLTHAHLDHAGGTAELARRLDVPIEGPHTEDQFWIDLLPEQAMQFGFPEAETFTPDRWFEDGDTLDPEVTQEFIDCYVMGLRTYETALDFEARGFGWSYGDKPTCVLTRRDLPKTRDTVEFCSGELAPFVNERLKPTFRSIWFIGGGAVG